jgi:enoyl-CoA hydratase/carnithine racemase
VSTDYPGIVLEGDGPVATLRLDRPHVLNAIDRRMRDEWIRLLRVVEADKSLRVLIITGTGRAFCTGGDVNEQDDYMLPDAAEGFHGQYGYQEIVRLIRDISIPVISAVNGVALGGGTAVALMSDMLVASEDAQFGVGQIVRGFSPDVGLTYILPRLVGTSRALQMMMLYDRIDAEEARQMGFVNWVVPADQVIPKALEVADRIIASPRPAVEWIKRVTYDGLDIPFNVSLRYESMAQAMLATTTGFTESLAGFRAEREERRKQKEAEAVEG